MVYFCEENEGGSPGSLRGADKSGDDGGVEEAAATAAGGEQLWKIGRILRCRPEVQNVCPPYFGVEGGGDIDVAS